MARVAPHRRALKSRGAIKPRAPAPGGVGALSFGASSWSSVELGFLGRAGQRGGRALAAAHEVRHVVEVAGADLVLVLGRRVAHRLRGELALLQLRVGGHAALVVLRGEHERAVVEHVEAREGDELELVAHRAELTLELGDRRLVEVLLPVEARAAVVGELLVREVLEDRLGELLGLLEIRGRGLHPEQVGDRGVGLRARDAALDAGLSVCGCYRATNSLHT